jgi:N6-adenosine-specific RNA methylase IME4
MASSILYQSYDASLVLADVPRSIEISQGDSTKRIISSTPLSVPYPSLEPKSSSARAIGVRVELEDLLLQKRLELALQELKTVYQGEWCLPRVNERRVQEQSIPRFNEKKSECKQEIISLSKEKIESVEYLDSNGSFFYTNKEEQPITVHPFSSQGKATIPPRATILSGEISATLPIFTSTAPKFSFIILDPPWPNRSARRSKSYGTSHDTRSIHSLLSSLPLEDHLVDNGLIAVWITNKPVFREILIGEEGLFSQWGVTLMEEWIWLKVTSSGEPICALNSTWRKPWEVLLVGRHHGEGTTEGFEEVRRRVIVAVPDVHSRKPNMKVIFEHSCLRNMSMSMGNAEKRTEGMVGDCLEIFARNVTTGWWAWGNEVLKFQTEEYWVNLATSPDSNKTLSDT